jgi:hypothetical protein
MFMGGYNEALDGGKVLWHSKSLEGKRMWRWSTQVCKKMINLHFSNSTVNSSETNEFAR